MNLLKEKDNHISKIVSGTFSLTVSTIILKLLGLIYKIPLAGILGDEGMGYFNSAYTVYTFFYLLCTAGVPKAVMILASEAKARGSNIDERRIVDVSSKLFLYLGVAVCLLFIIFSAPLAKLIGNSKSAATMLAIAPSIVFISLAGVIKGYLNAEMKLFDIAISQIIEGVGKLVLGLVLALVASRLGLPLEIISALTILGVTLGALLGLVHLLICSKNEKTDKKAGQSIKMLDNKPLIKRIFRISLPITLSAAVMSITNIIDLALIMRSLESIGYSESEAAALYGNYTTLAVPMFNLAVAIITPIAVAHLPMFTEAAVKADLLKALTAEKSAFGLVALISAPFTIGLIAYSKEILDLIFPNSETTIGASLLCLLSPAILFSSLLIVVNTLLEANGKVSAPLITMVFGSIVKIIVSYVLINKPSFGISGAPIGTVASYATAFLVSIIIYSRVSDKSLPILSTSLSSYLFAASAVSVSKLVYLRVEPSFGKIASFVAAIILCGIIYIALTLTFILFNGNLHKKGKVYKFLPSKL